MSWNENPSSIPYHSDGKPLSAVADAALPADKAGVIVVGKDPTGKAVLLRVAEDGTLRCDPSGTTTQPVSDAGLGTDGAAPPSIAGTGVRGWLRAVYDRLVAGIGRTWTLASGADSVTVVAAAANPIATVDALVPTKYDYVSLGYTGDDLTSVTYKTGGSDGTTVATLTLGYTGGKLTSVARS